MAWVYLDDHFPDHPKVVAAGSAAAWLFVAGLAYCKRYETDGRIPKAQVGRLVDARSPQKLALRLCEVRLWEMHGDEYHVHDYSDWNKPAESRSAAGRKAAHARWSREKRSANAYANASESHGERTTNADASTCPPPHPPTDENKSSDDSHKPPDPPDDDQAKPRPDPPPVVRQAVAILAARDLATRQTAGHLPPIADPLSWENAAYDRRIAVAWPLVELARAQPDWTAEQLADFAEPPGTARTRAADPRATAHDAQQQAERARAERLARVAAGEACQACNDTGLTLDEDGNAVECKHP